jgi:DNA primase
MVYELRNERSEKVGYVGRDLAFADKIRKWENSDRTGKQPVKAKFPPGFAKGEFLYGAEVKRLQRETARAQLADTGLLVLEGMNDTIALDRHGLLSVSLCTNRITEGQIQKLVRWSHDLAGGKITLMLDNDPEGFEGSLDSLKKLSAHAHVRTVWTPDCFGGKFRGNQPEDLERSDLVSLFSRFSNGTILRLLDE